MFTCCTCKKEKPEAASTTVARAEVAASGKSQMRCHDCNRLKSRISHLGNTRPGLGWEDLGQSARTKIFAAHSDLFGEALFKQIRQEVTSQHVSSASVKVSGAGDFEYEEDVAKRFKHDSVALDLIQKNAPRTTCPITGKPMVVAQMALKLGTEEESAAKETVTRTVTGESTLKKVKKQIPVRVKSEVEGEGQGEKSKLVPCTRAQTSKLEHWVTHCPELELEIVTIKASLSSDAIKEHVPPVLFKEVDESINNLRSASGKSQELLKGGEAEKGVVAAECAEIKTIIDKAKAIKNWAADIPGVA